MMATALTSIDEFEHELIQERIRSGIRHSVATWLATWPTARTPAGI